MKKVSIGKSYYNKGKRYEVLGKSRAAILLRVTHNKQTAFQVIDFTEEYPTKVFELDKLNPFFTGSLYEAEQEYSNRNQLKIK